MAKITRNARVRILGAWLAVSLAGSALLAGCAAKPLPGSNTPAVSAAPSATLSATPSPTVIPSPSVKPTPSATPTPTGTPSPSATTVSATVTPRPTPTRRPVQLSEQSILSLLNIYKANLIVIQYYDLDSDGVKDAIVLYQDETADPYAFRLALSAINSATKKHKDIALPFEFGLIRKTAQLTLLPVKKAGQAVLYAIAGGQYGGTVAHVGYAVLKYTKNGWVNIFEKYQDNGMTYTLTMQDGPRATLTLENGQRFTLIPTDLETYRASGWIDSNGKLTSDAHVFDEHIGFSTFTFADEKGLLTLRGSQEIRGLHKLDVLARLDTVWQYDGTKWSVSAKVVPLSSTIQSE